SCGSRRHSGRPKNQKPAIGLSQDSGPCSSSVGCWTPRQCSISCSVAPRTVPSGCEGGATCSRQSSSLMRPAISSIAQPEGPPATPGPYGSIGFSGAGGHPNGCRPRSEEHTSELQSRGQLVCRLLLEKKNGP